MNEMPSPSSLAQSGKRAHPFERTILVMQGGGALGAYQAGVYSALHEAKLELDWISCVSIGAVNAVIIAGNPPDKRVDKLRAFWEMVSEPPLGAASWFTEFWTGGERTRKWANRVSALNNMLYGVPHFYLPRAAPPISSPADKPERVGLYDMTPLEATLAKLVDFDLINAKPMRLTIGMTNVLTGTPTYFDNLQAAITPAHVMAAGALPPNFPPVRIGDDYYWDGGVVTNSPMNFVVSSKPRYSALIFETDLFDPKGEMPLDITAAYLRSVEIHGATRINITIDDFRRQQSVRRSMGRLLASAQEELRKDPEIQALEEEARVQLVSLVRLKYETKPYETGNKIYEFSRPSMEEHWQAGHDDALKALNEPLVLQVPDEKEALRVFDVHSGWMG